MSVSRHATYNLVGAVLPITPLGPVLGFGALPLVFYAVLIAMVILYLVLIEVAKLTFHTMGAVEQPMTPPRPILRMRRPAALGCREWRRAVARRDDPRRDRARGARPAA